MDINTPSSAGMPVNHSPSQVKDSASPEAENTVMGFSVRKRNATDVGFSSGKHLRPILPADQSVPSAKAGSCSSVEGELTDAQKNRKYMQERKARNRVSSQKSRDKKRDAFNSLQKEVVKLRKENSYFRCFMTGPDDVVQGSWDSNDTITRLKDELKRRDKRIAELENELECTKAELVKADIDKEILRVKLTSNEIEIKRLKAEILQRDKTIASLSRGNSGT